MVTLPTQFPGATWHPIPNYNGWGAPYNVLDAQAFVVHSAEGDGDPPPRFYDGQSAGAHFWNKKDGTLLQLSPLDKPAWANGYLDLANGAQSPHPLVRQWYQQQLNPNWFTVSMEHEGVKGEPVTGAQLSNTIAVARWLESLGLALTIDTLLPHNAISATECPSGRIPIQQILDTIHVTPPPQEVPTPPMAQPTELFTTAQEERIRDLVNLCINGGPGQFADANGQPLPLIRDQDLLTRVAQLTNASGVQMADVVRVIADAFAAGSANAAKSVPS